VLIVTISATGSLDNNNTRNKAAGAASYASGLAARGEGLEAARTILTCLTALSSHSRLGLIVFRVLREPNSDPFVGARESVAYCRGHGVLGRPRRLVVYKRDALAVLILG